MDPRTSNIFLRFVHGPNKLLFSFEFDKDVGSTYTEYLLGLKWRCAGHHLSLGVKSNRWSYAVTIYLTGSFQGKNRRLGRSVKRQSDDILNVVGKLWPRLESDGSNPRRLSINIVRLVKFKLRLRFSSFNLIVFFLVQVTT